MLIPYAEELWSKDGILPDKSYNFTNGIFPNILSLSDSSVAVTIFICLLSFLSILLILGFQRQIVSVLLWYGWVCLFDRNNLISNPGIPFVGWILLCLSIIPKGEALCVFSEKKEYWEFPKIIFYGAWIIMSLSYSISGIDKLNSPSWRDGSAIIHLLNNPLARDWPIRDFLLSVPVSILNFLSWTILIIEISFAPLAIWKKSRKWIWISTVMMHFGILLIVDFADLTFGMLMIHLFTFDASWIKPKFSLQKRQILFFDGVCGLCNSTVDLLMREDINESLKFAPLQGETAKNLLSSKEISELKSVVFYKDGKTFVQSDAIIETGRTMGGFFGLAIMLKLIPKFLRNFFYDIIAKNRYKWFGVKETCRMPNEKEREKLLY
jgi:predicted DCC family thiol-disulfide oxidoreductase YuxK